jgi:hypothetical protein
MSERPSEPSVSRSTDGSIMCACGDRLADRIDGHKVVIDGMEYRFRRRDDHMTCRSCGVLHPMRQFIRGSDAPRDTGLRRRRTD